MFSRLLLAFTLFAFTSARAQTWHLVWSDEFNGPANSLPSESDWNFVRGWGPRGNHEIQFYCRPTDNDGPCDSKTHPNLAEDGNGNLVLTAIHSGQLWSSARLNTAGQTHHPLRPRRGPPPHGTRRRLLARLLAAR